GNTGRGTHCGACASCAGCVGPGGRPDPVGRAVCPGTACDCVIAVLQWRGDSGVFDCGWHAAWGVGYGKAGSPDRGPGRGEGDPGWSLVAGTTPPRRSPVQIR